MWQFTPIENSCHRTNSHRLDAVAWAPGTTASVAAPKTSATASTLVTILMNPTPDGDITDAVIYRTLAILAHGARRCPLGGDGPRSDHSDRTRCVVSPTPQQRTGGTPLHRDATDQRRCQVRRPIRLLPSRGSRHFRALLRNRVGQGVLDVESYCQTPQLLECQAARGWARCAQAVVWS